MKTASNSPFKEVAEEYCIVPQTILGIKVETLDSSIVKVVEQAIADAVEATADIYCVMSLESQDYPEIAARMKEIRAEREKEHRAVTHG